MAVEFGSPEAQQIIKDNKMAAIEAVLDTINWDEVEDSADVEAKGYKAEISFTYKGKTFNGEGESYIYETEAIRQALQDVQWQVKMALKNGEIPLE